MDEAKRGEVIAQGHEAKALLEDPTLGAAFDDMLQNLFERFLASQGSDQEILDLHRQAIAIKGVRGTLHRYVGDAQFEETNKQFDEDAK